ncbi:MAG: hypothetical protein HYX24_03810 [Candidatus Aenigmarchaeota archaeon]|nr:hypothetical protein [Candidatus Aenigmarchaeota archaeon]
MVEENLRELEKKLDETHSEEMAEIIEQMAGEHAKMNGDFTKVAELETKAAEHHGQLSEAAGRLKRHYAQIEASEKQAARGHQQMSALVAELATNCAQREALLKHAAGHYQRLSDLDGQLRGLITKPSGGQPKSGPKGSHDAWIDEESETLHFYGVGMRLRNQKGSRGKDYPYGDLSTPVAVVKGLYSELNGTQIANLLRVTPPAVYEQIRRTKTVVETHPEGRNIIDRSIRFVGGKTLLYRIRNDFEEAGKGKAAGRYKH